MRCFWLEKDIFEEVIFGMWQKMDIHNVSNEPILAAGFFPEHYMINGNTADKYDRVDLKRFGFKFINGDRLPGGATFCCKDNLFVGGYANSRVEAEEIILKVWKVLIKNLENREIPVERSGNDLLVNGRKICGATVGENDQNKWMFGFYVNLYVYNKIIRKIANESHYEAAGLSEFGITQEDIKSWLEESFDFTNINKLSIIKIAQVFKEFQKTKGLN